MLRLLASDGFMRNLYLEYLRRRGASAQEGESFGDLATAFRDALVPAEDDRPPTAPWRERRRLERFREARRRLAGA